MTRERIFIVIAFLFAVLVIFCLFDYSANRSTKYIIPFDAGVIPQIETETETKEIPEINIENGDIMGSYEFTYLDDKTIDIKPALILKPETEVLVSEGEIFGVEILGSDKDIPKIGDIFKNSAAEKAGLKIGDEILIVDSERANPINLIDKLLMVGTEESSVNIIVLRDKEIIPLLFVTRF